MNTRTLLPLLAAELGLLLVSACTTSNETPPRAGQSSQSADPVKTKLTAQPEAAPKAPSTSGTERPDQPQVHITNLRPNAVSATTSATTPAKASPISDSDSKAPKIALRGAPASMPVVLTLYADPVVLWRPESGGNGHSYQAVFAPGGVNWTDAEAWAVAHRGHLTSIGSAEENDFVFSLVQDPHFWRLGPAGHYFLGPWLGGALQIQSVEDSTSAPADWRWADNNRPFTFANWVPGQPDAGTASGLVMHFMSAVDIGFRPTWNDMGAIDHTNGFVVEYPNGLASAAPANPAPLSKDKARGQ